MRRAFVLAAGVMLLLLVGCQAATQSASSVKPSQPPVTLAVDPSDGSLLKAGGGIFRSTDSGNTWSVVPVPAELNPSAIQQVATISAAPGTVVAAGLGAGVIRSDDDGQSWSAISAGLPSKNVSALALHSFHPGTLYALIPGQGLFRTEDGGDRWQKMDDGPRAEVVGLAHSTLAGSMNTGWLYAATQDGPYLSMDCF